MRRDWGMFPGLFAFLCKNPKKYLSLSLQLCYNGPTSNFTKYLRMRGGHDV